ncbi:MAG: hypothetical protein A2351_06430 [Omnitrophica bacterium RIFOXYB12_FULL_50_7]|nr:MAG: hypothetical protein A2351_06430 [Omnitrophica bacterium RIFOXYB12_FULL_50_7]
MTFQDFLAQIQTMKVEEFRAQTEEYFEAVISREGLDPLHKILTVYFGPPLKPEGHSPSGKANRHAKPHGGIRKDQTMYFRQDGECAECALLWPWGGGSRITIKVIQSKSSGPATGLSGFLATLFGRK